MICQIQMCVPPSGFIEKMCYICTEFRQINRDLYESSGMLVIIVLIRLFSKQFIKQSNRVKVYE